MNDNWNKLDFELPESEPEQVKKTPKKKEEPPPYSGVFHFLEILLYGIALYHIVFCTMCS